MGSMEVSAAALDFLLIEAVPLSYEVTKTVGRGTAEEAASRTEALGYRVGRGLAINFTRDQPPFASELDIIKFVCKNLWQVAFGKAVDNLKTNHRDTYVLSDNVFAPAQRMSGAPGPRGSVDATAAAEPHLWFPAGILRGFLAGVGVQASVNFDCTELPAVQYRIVVSQ